MINILLCSALFIQFFKGCPQFLICVFVLLVFLHPSSIFTNPGSSQNVNLHLALQISQRDTGWMIGIVHNIANDGNNLENDDEDYNGDDLIFCELMNNTETIFNFVGRWIKGEGNCQCNIFRHDDEKVEDLSQKCWLVFGSDVREIIIVVGIEACHGVEQQTYDIPYGQWGWASVQNYIEDQHDQNMTVVDADCSRNIKMTLRVGEVNKASNN